MAATRASRSPVAHEGPHLTARGVGNAAAVEIFEEPSLVNRHQRITYKIFRTFRIDGFFIQ